MVSLVNLVFKELGFNSSERIKNDFFPNVSLFLREEINTIDFFLVGEIHIRDLLNIDLNKAFVTLNKKIKKSKLYLPELDKNTSFLLLVEIDEDHRNNSDIYDNKEMEIEENPYFFKKYVLCYEKDIFNRLEYNYTQSTKNRIIDYIKDYVLGTENFNKFKASPLSDTYYLLLAKILIKIPIITLNYKEQLLIKPLSSEIREKTSLYNLDKTRKLVSFILDNIDEEDKILTENIINFWDGGVRDE